MIHYIGCSGFSYKEWKGAFYPDKLPSVKWFEFYCEHFKTLELNVTFYRFPTTAMMVNWNKRSPDDFSFAVKAPRLVTHYKQLSGTEEMLRSFYSTCKEGLQDKLGPILFQFPKQFIYNEKNLEKILNNLDQHFMNVVEFRHPSWWDGEIYAQLSQHKIIFCGNSHPQLPVDVVVNNPVVYYRFHGIPRIYYSEYEQADLKNVADKILSGNKVTDIYCYFNNTASLAAIKNANWLCQYLQHNIPKKATRKTNRKLKKTD